jgi:hypothetical protein
MCEASPKPVTYTCSFASGAFSPWQMMAAMNSGKRGQPAIGSAAKRTMHGDRFPYKYEGVGIDSAISNPCLLSFKPLQSHAPKALLRHPRSRGRPPPAPPPPPPAPPPPDWGGHHPESNRHLASRVAPMRPSRFSMRHLHMVSSSVLEVSLARTIHRSLQFSKLFQR